VGPRAGLDKRGRGKVLCLCRRSNLDYPVVQSVARRYTDLSYPAHDIKIDLKEICYEDVAWIELAQDRLQLWAVTNSVMQIGCP
jgi:hypothetical protein